MYICICGHFSLINDNCKHCMFSRFDLDLHVWIDFLHHTNMGLFYTQSFAACTIHLQPFVFT